MANKQQTTQAPSDPLGNNTVPTIRIVNGLLIIIGTAVGMIVLVTPLVRNIAAVIAILFCLLGFHLVREIWQLYPDFQKWNKEQADDRLGYKLWKEEKSKQQTPQP